MKNIDWRELLRVGYSSDYLERVRSMERIIRAGQSEFRVHYRQSFEADPVVYGIYAFTDVILFEGAMPLLFKKDELIQLGEAARLTLESEGKVTLERALVAEIKKLPKSSGGIELVT